MHGWQHPVKQRRGTDETKIAEQGILISAINVSFGVCRETVGMDSLHGSNGRMHRSVE